MEWRELTTSFELLITITYEKEKEKKVDVLLDITILTLFKWTKIKMSFSYYSVV